MHHRRRGKGARVVERAPRPETPAARKSCDASRILVPWIVIRAHPTHEGDRHVRTSRPDGSRYRRRPDPHHSDTAGPSLHPAVLGVAGRTRRRYGYAILEQHARAERQPATPAGYERPVPARRTAPSPTARTAAATALSAAQPEPVAYALSAVSSLATPDADCRVGMSRYGS
jgi:hypothetical protein